MKFFHYNEALDKEINLIIARVRRLMNGEVAHQIKAAGLSYREVYGVSTVNLKGIAREFKPSNDISRRLWFMGTRETMILATMLSVPDQNIAKNIIDWADDITNIELAEQIAFNFLGKHPGLDEIIEKWMLHPGVYSRYAALMAIGWQYRFVGMDISILLARNLCTIENMASDARLSRAIIHCFNMTCKHDGTLKTILLNKAYQWISSENRQFELLGEEILKYGQADFINEPKD